MLELEFKNIKLMDQRAKGWKNKVSVPKALQEIDLRKPRNTLQKYKSVNTFKGDITVR